MDKPWGKYVVLEDTGDHWIKKLHVDGGARLSLQAHEHRSEIWVVLSGKIEATKGATKHELEAGDMIKIEKQERHRIAGIETAVVLEVAFGRVIEDDIVRFEDDYGREDE